MIEYNKGGGVMIEKLKIFLSVIWCFLKLFPYMMTWLVGMTIGAVDLLIKGKWFTAILALVLALLPVFLKLRKRGQIKSRRKPLSEEELMILHYLIR